MRQPKKDYSHCHWSGEIFIVLNVQEHCNGSRETGLQKLVNYPLVLWVNCYMLKDSRVILLGLCILKSTDVIKDFYLFTKTPDKAFSIFC